MPNVSRRFELKSAILESINVLVEDQDIPLEDAIESLEKLSEEINIKLDELRAKQ